MASLRKNNTDIVNVKSDSNSRRIDLLDSLRGFAVLGILIMNIQSFAMPSQAYFNPFAWGNESGELFNVAGITYILTHVLIDQKFMTIFSLLFGVSMVLMAENYQNKQPRVSSKLVSPLNFLLRRYFFLLLIGLVHAYFIWEGDILVSYSLCAFFIIWFRNKSITYLIVLGLFLFFVPIIILLLIGASVSEDIIQFDLQKDWVISQEELKKLIQTVNGTWLDLFKHRAIEAFEMQTWLFAFYTFWRVSALMLWGMAIYKLGLFKNGVLKKYLFLGSVVLISIGLVIVILGVQQNDENQWRAFYYTFFGSQFNYIGSVILGIGYVLAFILLNQYFPPFLNYAMQCVGRTALSNYLIQSLICAFIFYGYGLGFFAKIDRLQILPIVLFIWLLQVAISILWMKYFCMGPVEWAWRTLISWNISSIKN